ncbi:MAG TPA: ATP-dependent sacrificial sulfur transferase LarE [Anaerolineaceae bacterium]|nr:ATP-dependent sacrificial sulfur transferase LarE [Anaerolineaceae bacterium]
MNTLETTLAQLELSGIPSELSSKWKSLFIELQQYQSAAIAFSGGVDSSFLAYMAFLALGEHMVAITIQSALEPTGQVDLAANFAKTMGFKQVIIPYEQLQNPLFRTNPVERCYHCKTAILHTIWDYARNNNLQVVLEGQNADDQADYRPGRKAVQETGTFSPLANNGFTKAEIRWISKVLGLPIWDQPSSPCLASRFPYGVRITEQGLEQIARAEAFLHVQGFKSVRVRYHNDLARIEVMPDQLQKLLELRDEVVKHFKQIGFLYVSMDLQGYRQGSLNEGLNL